VLVAIVVVLGTLLARQYRGGFVGRTEFHWPRSER
jgi:hypothetical protein